MRKKDFTPSFLKTLDDLLLNYGAIDIIMKFYLKDLSIYNSDPFINLLLMDSEILKQMPTTYFYVGDEDPLYDDSVRFLELLANNKIQCKFNSYNHLPHGILGEVTTDWISAQKYFQDICNDF